MYKDVEQVTTNDWIEVVVDAEDFDPVEGWVSSRSVLWVWPEKIYTEGDYTVFSGEFQTLRGDTRKWERRVFTKSMMEVL